ncbi:MAG TPA: hypothetical protein VNU71_19610 [Burkholderiaceae bacterium]|nr:hypothetical protein [Burkholderiaceae bacterium]
MSMKKTDLEKQLAKKLDGRLKTGAVPQRFGKSAGSVNVGTAREKPRPAVAKLIAVSCRLPADLVNRLRERAIETEGGMSALVAQAVEQWLASAGQRAPR